MNVLTTVNRELPMFKHGILHFKKQAVRVGVNIGIFMVFPSKETT
jgi:hypothetical protein